MKRLVLAHDGSRRRPRYSRDQRQQWVNSWRFSGLSQVEFAAQHNLRVSTLPRWAAEDLRHSPPTSEPPAFQERHTCATQMLEGVADIRFIQQLLGHAKVDTTAIYAEVSILQLQEVHARGHPLARLAEAPAPDAAS